MNRTRHQTRRRVGRCRGLLAPALLLLVALPARAGDVPFSPLQLVSAVPDKPQRVFSADLDGDGDVDVLSASVDDDTIAWYENTDGAGSFGSQQVISTLADGAIDVIAADLDGDGDLDVVSTSRNDDEIAWYENTDGAGSFGAQQVISTLADGPRAVRAADIDGDGDLDLVSASADDDEIAWYENTDGAGSFGVQQPISNLADRALSIDIADVDGDGDLDVLSASANDDEIAWYENTDGAGSFGGQQIISSLADFASRVFAADVDGDGDLDVLSASQNDDEVAWYENTDGAGSFGGQQVISSLVDQAFWVSAADLDADGDLDVLASSIDFEIVWFENTDGAGSFSAKRQISNNAGVDGEVADLDGDGDLDLLASNGNEVEWFENESVHRSARFTDEIPFATDPEAPEELLAVDVDRDGAVDLVVVDEGGDAIHWYRNDGSGDPSGWTRTTVTTAVNGPQEVTAGDLDGDGDVDLASASYLDDTVAWWENTGPGGDGSSWSRTDLTTSADSARRAQIVDLDGDGDRDVVFSARSSSGAMNYEVGWFDNTSGDASSFTARTISSSVEGPFGIAIGDLDGDGDLDVASASEDDDSVNWHENTGGALAWTDRVIDAALNLAQEVALADLNADGRLDVVATPSNGSALSVYLNQGGSPPTFAQTAVGSRAVDLAVADLDRDGDVDVLSADSISGAVRLQENLDGSGTSWQVGAVWPSAYNVNGIELIDMDRDGDLDLAAAIKGGERFSWIENLSGSLELETEAIGGSGEIEGTVSSRLEITATHVGRSGDSDVELASIRFLLTDGDGALLDSAQANALFDRLRIYTDDGSGVFESGLDTLALTLETFALSAGQQDVLVPDGDPEFQVSHGTPVLYHVVLEYAANASSQTPSSFRIAHRTAGSTAEDAAADLPVDLAGAVSVIGPAVTLLTAGGDADGDGLTNSTEVTLGSDALLVDTDGDGLSDFDEQATPGAALLGIDPDADGFMDGVEVLLGSDPGSGASTPTIPPVLPFAESVVTSSQAGPALFLDLVDLDGDGDLDAVAGGSLNNSLAWLDNVNGDASAFTLRDIATGTEADDVRDAEAVDLDGDGDLDVMAVAHDRDELFWYENLAGDGLSWTTHLIADRVQGPAGLSVADVDGDGDLDVAVAHDRERAVSWHENSAGDASTWTRHDIQNGIELDCEEVVGADFDGDGDVDLGVVERSRNRVLLFENTMGDGSSWNSQVVSTELDNPSHVAAADMDGDGDLDLVSESNGGALDGIVWFENRNDASDWSALHVVNRAEVAESFDVADLDADGDPDLALTGFNPDFVGWYENAVGDGTLWLLHTVSLSPDNGGAVAIGDLDGDGDLDLMGASSIDDTVRWYENQSIHRSALFDPAQRVAILGIPSVASVTPADVDGDGDLDAFAPSTTVNDILWLENTAGDGSAWATNTVDGDFTGGTNTINAGDVDGDGDVDAIATNGAAGAIAWFENSAGDGSSWSTHAVPHGVSAPEYGIGGDVDGDGDLDLIVISGGDRRLTWFENALPATSWTATTVHTAGGGVIGNVEPFDMDGDGDLDLGWVFEATTVAWFDNTAGDGSAWTQRAITTTTGTASATEMVDLDRDGDLDVIVGTSDSEDAVFWMENLGGASSWAQRSVGAADDVKDVRGVDLDLDGDVDIAAASSQDDSFRWFENTDGAGLSWTEHLVTDNTDFPSRIVPADLDGDGDPDLVTASAIESLVSWFPNNGGQFQTATTDSQSYLALVEGRPDDVLDIQFAHRGRAGDSSVELTGLELRLEDGVGGVLSEAQADALFATIAIFVDSGPPGYDVGDVQVASLGPPYTLASGVLSIPTSVVDAAPPSSSPAPLMVVVDLAATAAPADFQIVHLTESTASGSDDTAGVALRPERESDTGSGVLAALDPTGDEDGDGLQNDAEVDTHGTDPGNADTDADGLGDGDEISTHGSDPLLPDSDFDGLGDGEEIAIATSPTDPDHDDDGYCDGPDTAFGACTAGDNCPAVSNAGQENSDVLSAGDVCQCGDVDGSNVVDATDLQAVREYIVDRSGGPPFDLARCDVFDSGADGTTDCDVADAAAIERVVEGASTSIQDVCDAYKGP